MPEISRFLGIIVAMFYNDHVPPHFHARYGEHKVEIAIESIAILAGSLPPRALGLLMEWAKAVLQKTRLFPGEYNRRHIQKTRGGCSSWLDK
jgi:hypothetical protein